MKKNLNKILLIGLLSTLTACGIAKEDVISNETSKQEHETTSTSKTSVSEEVSEEINPSVTIKKAATMVVGDTTTLTVYSYPDTLEISSYAWLSENNSIVTVDENGLVSAISAGTSKICATFVTNEGTFEAYCDITVKESAEESIVITDQNGDFNIETSNGSISSNDNVYTLSSAGTYTLSGNLNGQIVVDAGSDEEVNLELNGVTISYDKNSPILVTSADSVTIKASKSTKNTIYDNRNAKTIDDANQGEGAISAKCDLKFAATGSLYVEGNYNNGIHTTKDLKIQKQDLIVKANNNAIKGKDSVSVISGNVVAISTSGDGIKTENSDISSKGNQRGTVTIGDAENTPNVKIYSAGDGIQASYNFEMVSGNLDIYTGSYSSYTNSKATVSSYKGIKVKNELNIYAGELTIQSYDDALHADYGTAFENGNTGLGTINISGGKVTTAVNSSNSRYVSGADAIHADNTLNISGGTIDINSAYEGLEANHINISDGNITIVASDDGINAAKKINETPSIVVSGGKIDITMGGGDTDGIDSNGSFTQTGGTIIVRGAPNSNSAMATGLDCDGQAKITGGTFVQLGPRETVPTLSNAYTLNYGSTSGGGFGGRPGRPQQSSSSLYVLSSGTWTISGLDLSFSVANGCSYYGCVVYSSSLTKANSYTLSNGTTTYTATAS